MSKDGLSQLLVSCVGFCMVNRSQCTKLEFFHLVRVVWGRMRTASLYRCWFGMLAWSIIVSWSRLTACQLLLLLVLLWAQVWIVKIVRAAFSSVWITKFEQWWCCSEWVCGKWLAHVQSFLSYILIWDVWFVAIGEVPLVSLLKKEMGYAYTLWLQQVRWTTSCFSKFFLCFLLVWVSLLEGTHEKGCAHSLHHHRHVAGLFPRQLWCGYCFIVL